MKATTICLAAGLCLFTGVAIADDCKAVNVRVGLAVQAGPCTHLGMEFVSCLEAPVQGTLNGTYFSYLPDFGDYVEPGEPYAPAIYGRSLAVIETNRGAIEAQEWWLINWNTVTPDLLPFVSQLAITGGTDDYEDATGWIGVISVDVGGDWTGWMRGEVCTP